MCDAYNTYIILSPYCSAVPLPLISILCRRYSWNEERPLYIIKYSSMHESTQFNHRSTALHVLTLVFAGANISLRVPTCRLIVLVVKANEFLFKPITVKKKKLIACPLSVNFVGAYMYMYERIQFTAAPKSSLIQKVLVVIYIYIYSADNALQLCSVCTAFISFVFCT